jgi:hypothetical protein
MPEKIYKTEQAANEKTKNIKLGGNLLTCISNDCPQKTTKTHITATQTTTISDAVNILIFLNISVKNIPK